MSNRERFIAIRDHLQVNWSRYKGTTKNARGVDNPLKLISAFADAEWPNDDSPRIEREFLKEIILRKFGSDLTAANERLILAARDMGFATSPLIRTNRSTDKDPDQPYFVVWEGGTAALVRIPNVVVVGRLWRTEASAQFMEGVREMARQVGTSVRDERGPMRMDGTLDAGRLSRGTVEYPLLELVDRLKLDPKQHAILDTFDDHNALQPQREILGNKGFRVVTSSANGTVCKQDSSTGGMLARRCIEAQGEKPGVALIVEFEWGGNEKSHGQRGSQIKLELERSGLFEVHSIQVRDAGDPPFEKAADSVVEALKKAMKGKSRISAIFARAETVTERVEAYLRKERSSVRVYSERLLPTDLRLLTTEGTPLDAVCGVSFHAFGRFALRAAAFDWKSERWEPVTPILLTRETAMEKQIISMDRLYSQLPELDPELDGSEYAWHPEMRITR